LASFACDALYEFGGGLRVEDLPPGKAKAAPLICGRAQQQGGRGTLTGNGRAMVQSMALGWFSPAADPRPSGFGPKDYGI